MFIPRRMACGFEYELSYVAFNLSPFCSAAGGRHGDEMLRVESLRRGAKRLYFSIGFYVSLLGLVALQFAGR